MEFKRKKFQIETEYNKVVWEYFDNTWDAVQPSGSKRMEK